MTSARRVNQQPGYILHHRPFRNTSQILEIVTRDHGKIAVVARGSRGNKSRFAGILRPFLPLQISWISRSDLGTLTAAEAIGPPIGIFDNAIFSAFYINELLLHFLHRYDPQPEIFALYERVMNALIGASSIAANLRSFELEFLRLLGYAVNLDHEFGSTQSLNSELYYQYQMEQGLVAVDRTEGALVFSGPILIGIAKQHFEDREVLRAANRLLREIIGFHLGGKELKSRKVLMEMHRGRIVPPKNPRD